MLGVMGAMEVEVKAVLDRLDDAVTHPVFGQDVAVGVLDGEPLCAVRSGIGKVNAALAVAALVQTGATAIVFTGMAGGVAPGVHIGDAVVATSLVQHDVDVTDFGHEPGEIPGESSVWTSDPDLTAALAAAAQGLGASVHLGRIASGDQFIADRARATGIAKAFGALAVEMEGAAAAQAAARCAVPIAVLRWISDTADETSTADSAAFSERIGDLDLGVVRALIPVAAQLGRQA